MISIVVSTYNRSASLRDTLHALKKQILPDSLKLEIVVVDNNSRDATPTVVKEEAGSSPWPIRYYFEPSQGINFARNRGIKEAEGELIAFTDDDVLPESDWILELWKAAEGFGADCVGGKVLPLWLKPKLPTWMESERIQKHCLAVFALLDRGNEVIVADSNDANFLFGGNIAYRRDAIKDIGLFRTDLGPRGSLPMRGDDTEMMARAFKKKKKVIYVPSAVVRHKVQPERMKMSYIRRWTFFSSFSSVKMQDFSRRIPPWFVSECLFDGIKAVCAYLRFDSVAGVRNELLFWERLGCVVGVLDQRISLNTKAEK